MRAIETGLAGIIQKLDGHIQAVDRMLTEHQNWLVCHEREIDGDGDRPGIRTRVHSLEEFRGRVWAALGFLGATVLTVIGSLTAWIFGLFGNRAS